MVGGVVARFALATAARAPRAELRRYPIGHFEIYVGEPFERAVADQVDFLMRHLDGGGAGMPSAEASAIGSERAAASPAL